MQDVATISHLFDNHLLFLFLIDYMYQKTITIKYGVMIKGLRHYGSRDKATNSFKNWGSLCRKGNFESKFKDEQDFGKQQMVDRHFRQRNRNKISLA